MTEKCQHGIETDSYPLTQCSYCVPCAVEVHSHETLQAHSGHHIIPLETFLAEDKPIKPNLQMYNVGGSSLSSQEIASLDKEQLKLVESMTTEEIIIAINSVARKIQELRNLEKHLRVGKAKLELTLEGDLVNKKPVPKVRASTKARISAQERALESAAKLLGMSVEELKASRERKEL